MTFDNQKFIGCQSDFHVSLLSTFGYAKIFIPRDRPSTGSVTILFERLEVTVNITCILESLHLVLYQYLLFPLGSTFSWTENVTSNALNFLLFKVVFARELKILSRRLSLIMEERSNFLLNAKNLLNSKLIHSRMSVTKMYWKIG